LTSPATTSAGCALPDELGHAASLPSATATPSFAAPTRGTRPFSARGSSPTRFRQRARRERDAVEAELAGQLAGGGGEPSLHCPVRVAHGDSEGKVVREGRGHRRAVAASGRRGGEGQAPENAQSTMAYAATSTMVSTSASLINPAHVHRRRSPTRLRPPRGFPLWLW
jgi:hypothetical protein